MFTQRPVALASGFESRLTSPQFRNPLHIALLSGEIGQSLEAGKIAWLQGDELRKCRLFRLPVALGRSEPGSHSEHL